MYLDQLSSLAQVILVDLVLAGDNAIVIGLVASTVEKNQRNLVILFGISMAALMRIGMALITVQLLQVTGLLLIGGLLLLWIAWRLWRDLSLHAQIDSMTSTPNPSPRSLNKSILQVAVADFSMSLDNVLAVAGIARDHTVILIFGLVLSILLMAVGATLVSRILERHRWIGYIGLAVILWVSVSLIRSGIMDIQSYLITSQ